MNFLYPEQIKMVGWVGKDCGSLKEMKQWFDT